MRSPFPHPRSLASQRYEILFDANSPPKVDPDAPPAPPLTAKQKRQQPPTYSHYLQSKVVRALERLESESKLWAELDQAANGTPPPPTPPAAEGAPAAAESEAKAAEGGEKKATP